MSIVNKKKLKNVFLRKRKTLTDLELEKRNANIFYHFTVWLESKKLKNVHIFLSIEKNKEVDTVIFIKYLTSLGYNIIISKCDTSTHRMKHYHYESDTQLEENEWGIIEPVDGKPCHSSEIEAVIVPLIVFDKVGHRIGYGKGYYDRFLSECKKNCIKVGLSFTAPLDRIPYVETHDIPLDCCITPYGVYDIDS